MDVHPGPDGHPARGDIERLFDELCLRWAREADVIVQQTRELPTALVLLPRDTAADEVAIRLDGLRGNLVERGPAIVAELRPQTDPHDPAGLVLMLEARLGIGDGMTPPAASDESHSGEGTDGAVVYVSLGVATLRRTLGYRIRRFADGSRTLVRLPEDPPLEHFAWLDALLHPTP